MIKILWNFLVKNRDPIYKIFLIITCSLLSVYFFPSGGKFKYNFQKGRPWQYNTLYAPFDFAILKSEEELESEKQEILNQNSNYYRYNESTFEQIKLSYENNFSNFILLPASDVNYMDAYNYGLNLLEEIYSIGVLPLGQENKGNDIIFLVKGNTETSVNINDFFKIGDLKNWLNEKINDEFFYEFTDSFYSLFFEIIQPNIFFEKEFTEEILESSLSTISPYRGMIPENSIVISKGEIVMGENLQILLSLQKEFESQLWTEYSYYWIILGYSILAIITFLTLMLFIYNYRSELYLNNKKVTFIFLNVVAVISLTTLVVNFNTDYTYAIPICILPLILKTFFDPRLGLFAHVIAILALGFIVPNSFEFVFLQIIAGIVIIQSVTQLQNRANLFITVGQIVVIYIVGYIAFTLIKEGSISEVNLNVIGLFLINGLLTLFAQPLIYLYEKIFNLVSDVSLLELSDTNSPLLKELSNKAPGTFHHSLEVANLSETAASAIGANTLLARVGALYHDIGKINNPGFFSENQTSRYSPHKKLSPIESAKIIIDHVSDGVLMAKKNKLPNRVIDFIKTHHGTSRVYYFYKKAVDNKNLKFEENDFKYSGPKPFSKETAILMMADSVEAASKSLRDPDINQISDFVNSIIDKQVEEKQFSKCQITFADIETVKKVLIKKLINIYNLRIEYPK
ncbi:MAG: phosphohydrolase [Flavobacteriaceae bacterium]|nr:phosphohydrolase [Flavobacteriaceae bacterium]|tara:strand:+ start:27888 stop:29939 length:2052 start_codon:yes stop_codon:yes gene_type:complete